MAERPLLPFPSKSVELATITYTIRKVARDVWSKGSCCVRGRTRKLGGNRNWSVLEGVRLPYREPGFLNMYGNAFNHGWKQTAVSTFPGKIWTTKPFSPIPTPCTPSVLNN